MQITAEKTARLLPACLTCCLLGCGQAAPVAEQTPQSCGSDGRLAADIYGGVRATLAWTAAELECEGMPRPDGEGARLRFAGQAGDAPEGQQLAFILGLPDLVQGETARELPTNVTVIEEGGGRFFGTRGAANCWTDIRTHEKMFPDDSLDYRISGVLYCVAPLADLNGNGSISFADLKFTGRLNWKAP